ncbi:hypothetical protein Ciccas_004283 [Cichlidogyrus casuarinus]|uniref:Sodium/calcium exchanger membrane region domain-containing protein n=1 Tax=Cichlidogyrus casuarinus TaxID=1844966 RepID=A0ABD2QEA6_9PLAT
MTENNTPLATHDLAEDISEITLPVAIVPIILGSVIATIVYCTSRWYTPPNFYHRPFFALLGFITSIIWIYMLANELVNSLETLGIVWGISEAILGLTFMALASSIGDIMSNCLLAKNGYPRIAYAACMGAPIFNLLIGAGVPYTIKIFRRANKDAPFSFTLTQAVLFALLLGVLVMNVLVAMCTNWTLPRLYGALLILIYVSFVTVAVLIEVNIIGSPSSWKLLTGVE